MKVLKFGGSSVGTAESLKNVKKIVEAEKPGVIVVVSALGGITDCLLKASSLAEAGDTAYIQTFNEIRDRHLLLIDELFPSETSSETSSETNSETNSETGSKANSEIRAEIRTGILAMLADLKARYDSIFTLQVVPEKTRNEIVSYGERLSSAIISRYISNAVLFDSLSFIKTLDNLVHPSLSNFPGKNLNNLVHPSLSNFSKSAASRPPKLAQAETEALVRQAFADFKARSTESAAETDTKSSTYTESAAKTYTESAAGTCAVPSSPKIAIVPGFISTDLHSGRITNLGRGGSDYTASIIAAALDAESLEIWTDVDGFMTADPRIIKTSYVIDELSFAEAMELCNFGAKVIYAPALYPVYPKDIPVLIKNTFNPSAPGTVIRRNVNRTFTRTLTGITSIDDVCLLTLSGPSMVGIVGVDSRLFSSLSRRGISIFLVSQSSSETGISLGVNNAEAELAKQAVDEEFSDEIQLGMMNLAHIGRDLAAVSVVGENMKYSKGIAGKLFTTLGRNSIGILACAQGSSDFNISMIIERQHLRKALNVIHDSFFLSEYQELNLFLCGIGTVGGNLLKQIALQRQKLMDENNLKLNIVGIARSKVGVFDRDGIDPANYLERLEAGIPMSPGALRDEVIGMNIFNSVFVDCTASAEVAALYKDFFEHGISVVAANKIAASSDYDNYASLKALARAKGVKFLFETNVGAGLPIINTINALRNSGDKILKIEAVVSGTINFICNTISADTPFSRTVRMAKEQGYSEPDPRIDLSGTDVIRKLVILAREAGYKVNQEDVEAKLFVPKELFECNMEEFWKRLPSLDAGFEAERRRLEAQNKRWRFVASMEDGRFSVGLREFEQGHSFYVLEGSNNIVLLTTERYNKHPLLIQGYGAGASVTAAGVFADIMSIANV